MRIYEIDDALRELIDTDTGEIADYEAFAALSMERDRKLEGLTLAIKNDDAMIAALNAEKAALDKRIKCYTGRRDQARDYLSRMLGGAKFETPRCKVTFRRTPEAVYIEADQIPEVIRWAQDNKRDDLLRYKPPELDKPAIKAALKSGEKVPNAELRPGTAMRIE